MRPEPAIIVTGPPMGGASRVARALASVTGAELLPELNLFLASDIDGWRMQAERAQSDLGHGALRALALAEDGMESDSGVEHARQWIWRRGEQSPVFILQHIQQKLGAVVWPDLLLGWRPDYLARLQQYPSIYVLHVVRHPRANAAALARHYARQNFVPPVFRDFAASPTGELDPQLGWFQFHRNLLRLANLPSVRYERLHWEHFSADPESTLKTCLLNWGIRWQPGGRPQMGLRGPANAAGGFAATEFDDALFFGRHGEPEWEPDKGLVRETLDLAQHMGSAEPHQAL